MARGIYTATISIAAVTVAKTVLYLTAATGKILEIHSAHITNADLDTNENTPFKFHRITSLGTPTSTALTPAPHEAGDAAAASVVAGNVTASEPTYAAANVGEFGHMGVPLLFGWHFEPLRPEDYIYVASGASLGLRHLATITSCTMLVSVTFREIG